MSKIVQIYAYEYSFLLIFHEQTFLLILSYRILVWNFANVFLYKTKNININLIC